MVRIEKISQIVSNIKIPSYNQKVSDIDFSILKILQSWIGRVRINVHQKENVVIVKEEHQKNVSVIKEIFSKWKTKRQ